LLAVPFYQAAFNSGSPTDFYSSIGDHAPVRIGNGLIRSTYYLFQNLTVPPGSALYINNTHLVFVSGSTAGMSIEDFGSMYVNNSTISTQLSNGTGSFPVNFVVGNESGKVGADLYVKNSSLQFGGSIFAVDSTTTFIGSDIGCEILSNPDPGMDLGMSFHNCTIYSGNSSYDGFLRSNVTRPYIDGSMNYTFSNRTGPLSEEGYHSVMVSYGYRCSPDSYLEAAILNLTSSGNDSAGDDFVTVCEGNTTIENITLISTGGTDRLLNSTFTFPVPRMITRTAAYSAGGISVHYYFSPGTTPEIWNISLSLVSNDTESLYGPDNYNILLYNSTMISVGDDLGIGFQKMYSYGSMLNPEKNMVIGYGNSSVFIVGDYSGYSPQSYSSPPFLLYDNSHISVYKLETMEFSTSYGPFYNCSPVVTPDMIPSGLDRSINMSNMEISGILRDSPLNKVVECGRHEFIMPLLEATMNASGQPEFLGDYSVTMALSRWYFSIGTFPDCLTNQTTDVFPLNLPALFVSSSSRYVTVGNSSLSLELHASSQLTLTKLTAELVTNSSIYLVNVSAPISLSGGASNMTFNCYVPVSVRTGMHDIIIRGVTRGYSLTGENFTVVSSITVLPDVHASVSGFTACIYRNNVSVSFNLSNSGLSCISYDVILRTEFTGGQVTTMQSLAYLSACSLSRVSYNVSAAGNVSGFEIMLVPQNSSLCGALQYNYSINLTVDTQKPFQAASPGVTAGQLIVFGIASIVLSLCLLFIYGTWKRRIYYFCRESGITTRRKKRCRTASSGTMDRKKSTDPEEINGQRES
jgi:hypothetical protein